MKKIKKLTLALTLLFLILTGCTNLNFKKTTLNEPKLSNEFEEINKILADSTYSKHNLKLIAPKSGKHQLAINKFTDKLNRTFAIIFHKNKFKQNDFQNILRMSILQKDKSSNTWRNLVNLPCCGYDVDKIIFVQNKNNKNAFLIVGIGLLPKAEILRPCKHFFIYELDPINFHSIPIENEHDNILPVDGHAHQYEAMEIFDFDNSNENKLVSISQSFFRRGNLNLNIFEFDPTYEKIKKFANLDISKHIINANYEIKFDKKSFNKPALFVDFKHNFVNETCVFLINNLYNKKNSTDVSQIKEIYSNRTLDTDFSNSLSFDFDNDGCIEIAQTGPFPGYKISSHKVIPIEKNSESNLISQNRNFIFSINPKTSGPPQITHWLKLSMDNDKLKQHVVPTYTNFAQGYGIILPKNWLNKVSARYINQNKTVEFFEFRHNIYNDKNKILTLTTCQFDEEPPPDFFVIKTRGPFSFMAKLSNSNYSGDKNLLISKNDLEKLFFFVQNKNSTNSNIKEGD